MQGRPVYLATISLQIGCIMALSEMDYSSAILFHCTSGINYGQERVSIMALDFP